jgi:ubiquinone/menaquinone biosynthesis C-methylase UbiE
LYYKGEKYEPQHSPASSDFQGQGNDMRREILSRLALELRPGERGLKVLDIGTGFGSNAAFLSTNLPKETKIWTLDPSEDLLKQVEEQFRTDDIGKNVVFVKGTIEKLPFDSAFFDLAISLAVLHHLQHLGQGFKEVWRVLKPTGKLLLVDFRPEAHVLGFKSRHEKNDFFDIEKSASILTKEGFFISYMKQFQYWYIVESERHEESREVLSTSRFKGQRKEGASVS